MLLSLLPELFIFWDQTETQSDVESLESRSTAIINDLKSENSFQVSVKSYGGSYSLSKQNTCNGMGSVKTETKFEFEPYNEHVSCGLASAQKEKSPEG